MMQQNETGEKGLLAKKRQREDGVQGTRAQTGFTLKHRESINSKHGNGEYGFRGQVGGCGRGNLEKFILLTTFQ